MVKQNNIAIIGTGFSAATLKYFLKSEADFFEKSRGIGGRSSTRKVDGIGSFDHGLQYISTNHEEFSTFLGSNGNSIWDGKFIINFNKNKSLDSKKRIIHSDIVITKLIKKFLKNQIFFFKKNFEKSKEIKILGILYSKTIPRQTIRLF